MKVFCSVGVFVFLLVSAGCAPTATHLLHPVTHPGASVESFFVDGYEIAVSRGAQSVVAITGEKSKPQTLTLYVAVENVSEGYRIDVVPERMRVSGRSSSGREKDLYVYLAHEYMGKLRASQSWSLAFHSVVSGLAVAAASWSESTTTGSVTGTQGSADVTMTTTTYDPASGSAVAARESANLRSIARGQHRQSVATNAGLLKATTLFPGDSTSGAVMIRLDRTYGKEFRVTMRVGSDLHEFVLCMGR